MKGLEEILGPHQDAIRMTPSARTQVSCYLTRPCRSAVARVPRPRVLQNPFVRQTTQLLLIGRRRTPANILAFHSREL